MFDVAMENHHVSCGLVNHHHSSTGPHDGVMFDNQRVHTPLWFEEAFLLCLHHFTLVDTLWSTNIAMKKKKHITFNRLIAYKLSIASRAMLVDQREIQQCLAGLFKSNLVPFPLVD